MVSVLHGRVAAQMHIVTQRLVNLLLVLRDLLGLLLDGRIIMLILQLLN